MEIVQERLERESRMDIVQTAPNVTYEILDTDGQVQRVDSPSEVPDPTKIVEFRDELPKTNVGKILRRALKEEEA